MNLSAFELIQPQMLKHILLAQVYSISNCENAQICRLDFNVPFFLLCGCKTRTSTCTSHVLVSVHFDLHTCNGTMCTGKFGCQLFFSVECTSPPWVCRFHSGWLDLLTHLSWFRLTIGWIIGGQAGNSTLWLVRCVLSINTEQIKQGMHAAISENLGDKNSQSFKQKYFQIEIGAFSKADGKAPCSHSAISTFRPQTTTN